MLETTNRKSPAHSDLTLSPTSTRGLTMLRSIDTKPPSPDAQDLITRLLMLSIELERKDCIIRELLITASNDESHQIVNQLSDKCHHYEREIQTLTQTIAMLKDNIRDIEAIQSREMIHSAQTFNEQMENKIHTLESKLRLTQQQKFDLEEQLKKNRLDKSMADYQLIKTEQTQKSRSRELQSLLLTERNKLENERRLNIEKNIVIEDLRNRLTETETRQHYQTQQYEDKLKLLQTEMHFQQNMKKSQIVNTEQKISAHTQEINKLAEENRYLKQHVEQLRDTLQNREQDLHLQKTEYKSLENQLYKQESELRECNAKLESRAQQFRLKDREVLQRENAVKRMQLESEELKFQFTNKTQEVNLYREETERLKAELSDLYNQIDSQKMEMRKLKRRPAAQSSLCESCRLREGTASHRNLRALDISPIIEQTEGVLRSNRKIESLIIQQQQAGVDSQFIAYRDQVYKS